MRTSQGHSECSRFVLLRGFKKPPLESEGAIHPCGRIIGLPLDSRQRKTDECIDSMYMSHKMQIFFQKSFDGPLVSAILPLL